MMNENGSNMYMPVAPAYGGGYGNDMFGGNGAWLILFLFAAMFGFGGGGFGNGMGGNGMFPWILASGQNTENLVQGGFNQAATAGQLNSIQNSITNGFANAEVAGCNRAMDAMQTAYGNQIASMNQSFANQQALDNRLFSMEMAQQNCCCENRLGLATLGADLAREACADRAAVSDALRDVIAANTASTQRILDQMCNDKIDAKNEKIAELQNQINMQNLAASQNAQTAQLIADNAAQSQYLANRFAPYYPWGFYGNGFGGNGNGYGFNPFGNVGFGNGSF